ncbi:MAG: UDP-glucose/GDP-mannose dehydrogenase family protein [Actinomycetota bacterium]
MKVVIVGCGHVGLVSAAGFAEIGHEVVGVDSDPQRLEMLERGEAPFYEPGLDELLQRHHGKALTFTADVGKALQGAAAAFICVNTPPRPDGRASLVYVEKATRAVAQAAPGPVVIVEKSTVPVHTARRITEVIRDEGRSSEIEVATNPEFLREGSAVHDTLTPERIVIGLQNGGRAESVLREIYAPIVERTGCPILFTDLETAELIKHASNSFLAMKISYINAVARLCEAAGADVGVVAQGMGLDPRIGPHHLSAGIGYGGFCFPKDLAAFVSQASELGVDLSFLDNVRRINVEQRMLLVQKVHRAVWNLDGKTIAVWGLAFKAGTDDLREAPSLDVIPALEREGAKVRAYDPAAGPIAKAEFPHAEIVTDAMAALDGADALIVLTEWPEFVEADLSRVKEALRRPVIVDGRNLWSIARMADLGFTYLSFGRPEVVAGVVKR